MKNIKCPNCDLPLEGKVNKVPLYRVTLDTRIVLTEKPRGKKMRLSGDYPIKKIEIAGVRKHKRYTCKTCGYIYDDKYRDYKS